MRRISVLLSPFLVRCKSKSFPINLCHNNVFISCMNKNMDFQVVEKVKHIQQRTGIGIISCINKLMGLQVILICKTYARRIHF